jgi:hypothetical protein
MAQTLNERLVALGMWWRSLFRRQSIPVEPSRSVQSALARLSRLSSSGIPVPEGLSTTVLAAQKELAENHGILDPKNGPALYDACYKLAVLAARLSDEPDVVLADSFSRAALNSEYMLKFASESGTPVPADVQADLIAGQATLCAPPDTGIRVRFYSAYAVLAKLLGNVTADTIKACRSPRTLRTLKRDETKALSLALVTVVISVFLFTAEAINNQLTDEITTANDLAIKLRGLVFPPVFGDRPPSAVPDDYVKEPCKVLAEPPKPGDFIVKSQADLDQIQTFAIAIRGVHSRSNKLNFFILDTECDPFGHCWWGSAAHNRNADAMSAPGASPTIRDRFELNPALSNYTAEFLCKVKTWQEVRSFASNVQKSYGATSGGVVAHALPILYALLGAYAYRLRQFGETVRNRTFHPSFADSARLITAVIAGAVAGLFNPVRDLAVSPLATAFLVGYGVEIFFRFLDSSLNAFGTAPPGGTHPPPPPGTNTSQPTNGGGAGPTSAPGGAGGQQSVGSGTGGIR